MFAKAYCLGHFPHEFVQLGFLENHTVFKESDAAGSCLCPGEDLEAGDV